MLQSRAPAVRAGRLLALAALLLAAATLALAAGCGDPAAPSPVPESDLSPPQVRAWSGILVERQTGDVLWSKEPDRELPPASTTKIMTALLVLERVRDLDEWATVPEIPIPQKVGVDLMPGDRITVREALYALLVESANDAALTLASHVAGSEPKFVVLMNRRARELGLTHTHFTNSRGTAEPGLFSSARDLATLARTAMRKATFRRIVATRETVITYPPDGRVPIRNHNRLLRYEWADGVKTGSNDASGKVLVGSGRPGPVALIVVTLHQRTREEEVADAVALFTWGTAEYLRRSAASAQPAAAASPSP
jgi:D-alanyl-D-alanine carboxypeptidase (penicillin-binding protein 5/6)